MQRIDSKTLVKLLQEVTSAEACDVGQHQKLPQGAVKTSKA